MKDLGDWGEQIAAEHLEAQGFRILERNWHSAEGELDILAELDECLVFVEVKARRSNEFGTPEEAVDARKQRRLQKAAWRYLEAADRLQADWRIDVIAIEQSSDGSAARLDHYINAVDAAQNLNLK